MSRGAWVGWDGGSDVPRHVEGIGFDLRSISLRRTEIDSYYRGFANRTLWPLLHGLVEHTTFERSWWDAYRVVNEKFSAAIDGDDEAFWWIHDYHLMLLPEMIRRRGARGRIGFFLHVPFPPLEIFARLPWRTRLLEGILGADAVSFQTVRYRDNFLRTCAHLLHHVRIHETSVRLPSGRVVETHAHPISIDAEDFAGRANRPDVERSIDTSAPQWSSSSVESTDDLPSLASMCPCTICIAASRRNVSSRTTGWPMCVSSPRFRTG